MYVVRFVGRKFGYSVDGNQELMAIGMSHESDNKLIKNCF